MGYFLLSWVFAAKKLIFSFIWPSKPVPFEVPVVSDNWICWSLFLDERARIIFLEILPNNTWWCRGCLTIFFKVFWPRDSTIFCNSPAVILGESLATQTLLIRRYRHTSSSRQFRNILCWLEIINYCPDGGDGDFHCSSSFLKATSLIYEAQLSFAAHQKYILRFFSLWWMIKGIWALLSLLFIFLWNRNPRLGNFIFIITLECSKLWIWMGIYFRDILLIRISRGANNCVQRVFENTFI